MEGMINVATVRQAGEETKFEAPEGYHIHCRCESYGLVEVMARKNVGSSGFVARSLATIAGDAIITQAWVKVS